MAAVVTFLALTTLATSGCSSGGDVKSPPSAENNGSDDRPAAIDGYDATRLTYAEALDQSERSEDDGARQGEADHVDWDGAPRKAAEALARLPLRQMILSGPEAAIVERATSHLRRPCMAEAGFVEPPFASAPPPALDAVRWERRYLYVRVSDARVNGYKGTNVHDEPFEHHLAAVATETGKLDDATREAWYGRQLQCLEAAEAELCADLHTEGQAPYCERRYLITNDDSNETWAVARASAAVTEAMHLWSACMEESGYELTDIDDAWELGTSLDDEEAAIELALDDTACKDRSHLVVVWATIEAAVQAELVARKPERYRDTQDQKHELLRRASLTAVGGAAGDAVGTGARDGAAGG